MGYFFSKKIFKNEQATQSPGNEEFIIIGNTRFYEQTQVLKYSNELIELTENERKLLKMFVGNQKSISG